MRKNSVCVIFITISFMLPPLILRAQLNTITAENGKVSFLSDAPLEVIKAKSGKLSGAVDTVKNTFAFAVPVNSFRGFNGDLQREHFHENYLETEKYPLATFAGKFIEQIDFSAAGVFEVRAKGMLTIHGIAKERIIKGMLIINKESISMKATFTVRLEDHDIKVPGIVNEKIAGQILTDVEIQFKKLR